MATAFSGTGSAKSPMVVGVTARLSMQILSFAQIMIASRFLDLAEFGVYALAWAAAVVCNTLLFTGYYHALLRSRDIAQDRDSIFWAIAALGAFAAALMAGIGMVAGGWATAIGGTFLMFAGFPLMRAPSAWNEAHLLRDARVRTVSLYVLIGETLSLLIVYFGLRAGLGITALVLGRYAAASSDLILTTAFVRLRPAFHLSRAALARGWQTARPLWGTNALGLFSNYGADMILGVFLSPAAVGAYRGGARISQTAADLILQPVEMLSWSRFSRYEKDGRGDLVQQAWLQTMALGAAAVWPVLFCFAMIADEIVTLMFAEVWGPVAPILALLCLSRAVYFLSILLEPTMVCRGRGNDQLRVRAAGAAVMLFSLLAFGRLSGEAAALAHLSGSLTVAVLGLILMTGALRVSVRQLAVALLPAAGIALICGAVIGATAGARAALGNEAGFAVTVGCVVVVWAGLIALGLRQKLLVLPTS